MIATEISKKALVDLNLVEIILKDSSTSREKEKAFEAIYNKYEHHLYIHFGSFAKNNEDAKELVLEALVKARMNLHKFDASKSVFSTWLFNITERTFIDFNRKKKLDTSSISDMINVGEDTEDKKTIEFDLASLEMNPEQRMIRKERNKTLVEVIAEIKNEDYKCVLKMKFFEEKNYEEIARELDIPVGTVKVLIFRAKAELKKLANLNNISI